MPRFRQSNVPYANPPHRQERKPRKVTACNETANSSNQPASKFRRYTTCQKNKNSCSVATDEVVVLAGIEATTIPRKRKRRKQDEQAVSNNIDAAEENRRRVEEDCDDDDDAFAGDDFSDVGENSDDEVDDDEEENQQRLIAPEVLEAVEGLEGSATRPADADGPEWGMHTKWIYSLCDLLNVWCINFGSVHPFSPARFSGAKANKAFFDLLEHLVYSGNGFSQGDFEKDDLNWRQTREQHVTLDTILKDLRRPSLSTQIYYRVYLKLWAVSSIVLLVCLIVVGGR